MLVEVTQEDIEAAEIKRHGDAYITELDCPIALALKRSLNITSDLVRVGGTSFTRFVGAGEGWHRSPLPMSARVFVREFDMRRDVAPFEFAVD